VKVNLHFLEHPERSGIFNVGTGVAQSFNDVAVAVVNACRRAAGEPALDLAEMQRRGAIEYIPVPGALAGKYQSFTQADLSQLRSIGYREPFLDVAQGEGRYVDTLLSPGMSPVPA